MLDIVHRLSSIVYLTLPGQWVVLDFALPQGVVRAHYIWRPEQVSSTALLPLAAEHGVTFAPGGRFFADRADGERYIRLNFATQALVDIDEGIMAIRECDTSLGGASAETTEMSTVVK